MPSRNKPWMGPLLCALLSITPSFAGAEDAAAPAAEAPGAEPMAEPAKPGTPVNAASVMAIVNGVPITVGHMLVLRAQLPEQYQTLPNDVLFKGILDQLVQQTALMQSMEGKTSVRDEISMENERRSFLAGAAINAASTIAITDEALKLAYDEKYAAAAPSMEFHAAHILVATEEEAKKLKAEIDAGADFAELAKAHSTDGAAANGGDLGWFGRGQLVKEFEDAVFKMAAGEVSEPVQTQFGWHLINLTETRSASAPALESVRAELEAGLRQKAVEDRIKELTAAAKVERMEAGVDPAVISDQTLLGN